MLFQLTMTKTDELKLHLKLCKWLRGQHAEESNVLVPLLQVPRKSYMSDMLHRQHETKKLSNKTIYLDHGDIIGTIPHSQS